VLTIRNEQIQLFEERFEREFAARLAAHLRKFFPFRFVGRDDAVVQDFALRCVKHAKGLGVQSERGIAHYADLATLIGIGFEATDWGISADLVPQPHENHDHAWLDRIIPIIERRLRERELA